MVRSGAKILGLKIRGGAQKGAARSSSDRFPL